MQDIIDKRNREELIGEFFDILEYDNLFEKHVTQYFKDDPNFKFSEWFESHIDGHLPPQRLEPDFWDHHNAVIHWNFRT